MVGLTDKQREHTSDIEWRWAYREIYELIKKGAGRPKEKCAHGEHILEGGKCAHDGYISKSGRAVEILDQKYDESRASMQHKIRLTYLIPELQEQYEKKK